eukprot:6211149-Pleurochrysis_carterae.AAC.2
MQADHGVPRDAMIYPTRLYGAERLQSGRARLSGCLRSCWRPPGRRANLKVGALMDGAAGSAIGAVLVDERGRALMSRALCARTECCSSGHLNSRRYSAINSGASDTMYGIAPSSSAHHHQKNRNNGYSVQYPYLRIATKSPFEDRSMFVG